jgi:mannose-6-phosphate isomerase-like protein (cupin superfamily)
LHLEAGQSLKPHITPVDVFFYVLEGTPDIMVGTETVTVEPDSLIESPKDIIHCIYNNSDSDIRVLVVKAPRP